MRFRLAPTAVTLDDLERFVSICMCLWSPPQKSLSALNMRSDWFFLVPHFLTDDSLQSADKVQQESRAVAGNRTYTYDVVVKLDTYRNLQRQRAVLCAIVV